MFTAGLLQHIEENLTGGRKVGEFFDLIAGTSTGGIIALGLGLRKPASEIMSFYQVDGKKIFPPSNWYNPFHNSIVRSVRRVFRPAYSGKVIERILKARFQAALIGHSQSRLLLTAFMYPKSEIAVLKTDHHPVIRRDWKTAAWKAARATSAAPTFFSGLQDGEKVFADGGLWANNPTMLAVLEAYSCFELSLDQIRVLSIGCGNPPVIFPRKNAFGGLWSWKRAFELSSFLTTDNFWAQAAILLGPENVVRLRPEAEADGVAIDDWREANRTLPVEARRAFNEYRATLEPFFADVADPWTRYYSQELLAGKPLQL